MLRLKHTGRCDLLFSIRVCCHTHKRECPLKSLTHGGAQSHRHGHIGKAKTKAHWESILPCQRACSRIIAFTNGQIRSLRTRINRPNCATPVDF